MSKFSVGNNNGNSGSIIDGYIEDYKLTIVNGLDDEIGNIYSYGIPTSISLSKKNISNSEQYCFIYSDKYANIYCYNENQYDEEEGLNKLFQITKYNGYQSLNTPTIIDNKYAIFTFNTGGRGKVVCVDIEKALKEAEGNVNKIANNSILWETDTRDSKGPAFIGATGISINENDTSTDIVLIGDEGKNPDYPNLRAYYVDKHPNQIPVKVDGAFLINNDKGKQLYSHGVYLEGGVKSEPAFADDIFVVMDGTGVLHGYSLKPQDNLSINNLVSINDSAKKGEMHKISVELGNTCNKDIDNVDLRLYGFDKLLDTKKVLIKNTGTTTELEYTVPVGYSFDNCNLRAELNMNERVIEEITYDDNVKSIEVPLTGEVDLEVVEIEKTTFYPGITSPIRVKVRNNSDKSFKNIGFLLEVNNQIAESKPINLGANKEGYISFRLNTPRQNCEFTLKATINYDKAIQEINYENNVKEVKCNVKYNMPPEECEERIEWVETRFSHYETHEETWIDDDGNTCTNKIKIPVFKDVDFYAEMILKAEVEPETIKSGYGIEINIETDIKHNYDKPATITGAQRVIAYFPDGSDPVELIPDNDKKNHWNTWKLPVNQESVLKKRNHYIPVNWPDGDYMITIKAFESSTPGGKPCMVEKINVNVKGHMYMDDVTS